MILLTREPRSVPLLHNPHPTKRQSYKHLKRDTVFHRQVYCFWNWHPLLFLYSTVMLDSDFISDLHEHGSFIFHREFRWFTWMLPLIFEYRSVWHGLFGLSRSRHVVPEYCFQRWDVSPPRHDHSTMSFHDSISTRPLYRSEKRCTFHLSGISFSVSELSEIRSQGLALRISRLGNVPTLCSAYPQCHLTRSTADYQKIVPYW